MPVTLFFAFTCIAVYLAMMAPGHPLSAPQVADLIAWGGNYRPRTIVDQPWRLLTSIFLHGGLIHLAMNTFALLDLGYVLEQKIGKAMMAVVFLLSGIAGALASVIWHPASVGVGASGAIMGVAGTLLVWLALPALSETVAQHRTAQIRALFIGVALTLGVGAFSEQIDNAAHAGGLVAGLILGILTYGLARARLNGAARYLAPFLLFLAGLLTISLVFRNQALDEYRFRQLLPAIVKHIERYGNVHAFLTALQNEEREAGIANILKRKKVTEQNFMLGINAWKTCILDVNVMARMKVTSDQKALTEKLIAYCGLRQKQYELLRAHALNGAPGSAAADPALARYSTGANLLFASMIPALQHELGLAPPEVKTQKKSEE